jgi:hypothetical protein
MTADLDNVGAAILQRIEPLLKHAQSISEDVESAKMRHELEGMLNASCILDPGGEPGNKGKRKQKRRPAKNNTGTVTPVGTPRTIRTAEKVHPDIQGNVACAGDAQPRKRKGFRIDFCEIDKAEIGDFLALTSTVLLNLNHPFIAEMKREGNRPAMYSAAVALVTDHGVRKPDNKPVLSCTYESFAKAFGDMMLTFTPQEKSDES